MYYTLKKKGSEKELGTRFNDKSEAFKEAKGQKDVEVWGGDGKLAVEPTEAELDAAKVAAKASKDAA